MSPQGVFPPGCRGRTISRSILDEALANLEETWLTGPLAEPTRALLAGRATELRRSLRVYDEAAAQLRERSGSWVVTHGEPHRGNTILDRSGRLLLIDWDTTLVAPRERDLWHVLDEDRTGWEEYCAVAVAAPLDTDALDLYRQRWELADVASFVAEFRRPHAEDENTTASFGFLRGYLDG